MTLYSVVCVECERTAKHVAAIKFPTYEARAVWVLEHHRATGHERLFLIQERGVPESAA